MSLRERPYAHADLPAAQAALAAWTAAAGDCGYCHVGDLPQRIYAQLRGAQPVGELVRLWEDDAGVAAVAICFRFGAAFDLFARPALRGTPAELELLAAAHAITLRHKAARPGDDPFVLSDVFSCDTTRMAQLARLGFAEYRVWDLITERSLAEPAGAPRLPAGFTLRRAAAGDYAQLAAARESAFGGGWTAEQYRDEVMARPGYSPGRELVVVAPDGRVAAFTVIGVDWLNRSGLLEPVGTHADFRRMGLARALIQAAIGEMRRLGLRTATIAHDATNLPALELYRGLGFAKKYETLGYRRA